MKRFAVYAAEQKYGGLHGMCSYEVIEAKDRNEAEEYACELSYEIMNSYSEIMEEIEEQARYYTSMEDIEEDSANWEDTFWSYISEIRDENTEYYVKEINEEKAKGFSTNTLNKFYSIDTFDFEEEFCLDN